MVAGDVEIDEKVVVGVVGMIFEVVAGVVVGAVAGAVVGIGEESNLGTARS